VQDVQKTLQQAQPLGAWRSKDSIERSPHFIRQIPLILVPSPLMDPLVGQAFLKFFGGIIGRHVIIDGFHPYMGPYVNEAHDLRLYR